jgi:hypothetical protein
MTQHDQHDEEIDLRHDPPRDLVLARALSRVDGPALPADAVAALRSRIVRDVAAQQADAAHWVLTLARPARRVLPWAAIAAAASLLFTWTSLASVESVEDSWSSAMLGGAATPSAVVASFGLPTSPDALLQESLAQ